MHNFLGSALLKTAQTEFKLGAGERDFINSCASNTLLPVRRFLEGDMKTIQVRYFVLLTIFKVFCSLSHPGTSAFHVV